MGQGRAKSALDARLGEQRCARETPNSLIGQDRAAFLCDAVN